MAGPAVLLAMVPLYFGRSEERMMIEVFGEAYHAYTKRTGRVFLKSMQ